MELTHYEDNFIEIYNLSEFSNNQIKNPALQQTTETWDNQTTSQINDYECRHGGHAACHIGVKSQSMPPCPAG